MEKVQKNRKMILVILVLAVIFATITIVISIKSNQTNTTSNGGSSNTSTNQTADNFIVTEGTSKLNTSTQVTADKKVGNILIQNSKIEYAQTKGSTLTAKVTNDSTAKENLRLKVKFIANDGSVISETVALVGKTDANQVKYISAGTTIDVTNAKNVTYEIVE